VALFNRAPDPRSITLKLSEVGFGGNATLRDLWTGKAVTAVNGSYTVLLPKHSAVLLKVSK